MITQNRRHDEAKFNQLKTAAATAAAPTVIYNKQPSTMTTQLRSYRQEQTADKKTQNVT